MIDTCLLCQTLLLQVSNNRTCPTLTDPAGLYGSHFRIWGINSYYAAIPPFEIFYFDRDQMLTVYQFNTYRVEYSAIVDFPSSINICNRFKNLKAFV